MFPGSWTGHSKHKNSVTKKQNSQSVKNLRKDAGPYTGPFNRSRSKELKNTCRVSILHTCELLSSGCA